MMNEQMVENEIENAVDTFEEQEDWTKEDEDRFNGEEAGVAFAQRHILDKITLFVKVYREKGYSEAFIEGFMEGINGNIGGNIFLDANDEEVTQALDNET